MKVEFLDVKSLRRHPVHLGLNVERNTGELGALSESIEKHGKKAPLLYVNMECEGETVPHVVDGWSSVLVALENGTDKIPGILVDQCTEDELPELIATLQSNYHNDPEEDYKRFEYFFQRYSKGQGYRSDLNQKAG